MLVLRLSEIASSLTAHEATDLRSGTAWKLPDFAHTSAAECSGRNIFGVETWQEGEGGLMQPWG